MFSNYAAIHFKSENSNIFRSNYTGIGLFVNSELVNRMEVYINNGVNVKRTGDTNFVRE